MCLIVGLLAVGESAGSLGLVLPGEGALALGTGAAVVVVPVAAGGAIYLVRRVHRRRARRTSGRSSPEWVRVS